MRYAIKLIPADDVFLVSCRDLPGVNSVGDTVEEALRESEDAIALMLQWYMDKRQPMPVASAKKRGEYWVALPALDIAKIGLYQAMQEQGLRKADLVRLLGVHGPQVDRLLSLLHKSKLEQVESALDKLGYRVTLSVEKRAA